MMQEVTERAAEIKPKTAKEVAALIKQAIATVYRNDLRWLASKKHDHTPEFLIAAKPATEDYCIFRIKGKRLYPVNSMSIIGYATPVNGALLQRMYRNDLPMQQAVMLAIYLVSLSKKIDSGVGFDTQVVVVTDNGAWFDDPDYISEAETRIEGFMRLTDRLFLACTDAGISPQAFEETLTQFGGEAARMHKQQLDDEVRRMIRAGLNTVSSPYSPIPPGTVIFLQEPPDEFLRVRADAQFKVDVLTKDHPVQFGVDASRVRADILRAQGSKPPNLQKPTD